MVVSSFVIATRFAVPACQALHFQLDTKVFRYHLSAGQNSDILEHRLAVTKAWALTAAIFRPPRSLFTTRVAKASPSISSAMISNGREA